MVLNFVVPIFVITAEIRYSYPIKYFTVTITIHYICSRDELKNSYWCSNDEIVFWGLWARSLKNL